MSKWIFVLDIRVLDRNEWPTLRDIRLAALRESPGSFLATYEQELGYRDERWQAEFTRGSWNIGFLEGDPISLLGVTREPGQPQQECFIEYLWVAEKQRGSGFGLFMLGTILKRLQADGVRTVFLWVLDRNRGAVRFYERAGFVSTNLRQPLADRPGQNEERMKLHLG
ncbi:MAG TPA: GNAT family N-acetyltransferase [Streptosporangiaceae bacterium]|nr:GNAT family N-acetyltransferase [Streptosporangiaceae bacterium]